LLRVAPEPVDASDHSRVNPRGSFGSTKLQTEKGRDKQDPASITCFNQRRQTPLRLTGVATTPRRTPGDPTASATSATTAASPAASATKATSATTAATTSTSPGGNFFAQLRLPGIFLIENIERGQADVGDLLLTEKDFMTR
jgi:hypothetical protein